MCDYCKEKEAVIECYSTDRKKVTILNLCLDCWDKSCESTNKKDYSSKKELFTICTER